MSLKKKSTINTQAQTRWINASETKSEISRILDQFGKEEIGNRLSQFALLSLKQFILAELDKGGKCEPVGDKNGSQKGDV